MVFWCHYSWHVFVGRCRDGSSATTAGTRPECIRAWRGRGSVATASPTTPAGSLHRCCRPSRHDSMIPYDTRVGDDYDYLVRSCHWCIISSSTWAVQTAEALYTVSIYIYVPTVPICQREIDISKCLSQPRSWKYPLWSSRLLLELMIRKYLNAPFCAV